MEIVLIAVLVALVAIVVGSGIGFKLQSILSAKSIRAVEEASAQQMRRANARSKEILLEAKEKALQVRSDAEAKLNEQKLEIQRQQSRVGTLDGAAAPWRVPAAGHPIRHGAPGRIWRGGNYSGGVFAAAQVRSDQGRGILPVGGRHPGHRDIGAFTVDDPDVIDWVFHR